MEFIDNNSSFIDISLKNINYDKCEILMKYTDNLRNFVKKILIYLLKMCSQDYEIMNEKKTFNKCCLYNCSYKNL